VIGSCFGINSSTLGFRCDLLYFERLSLSEMQPAGPSRSSKYLTSSGVSRAYEPLVEVLLPKRPVGFKRSETILLEIPLLMNELCMCSHVKCTIETLGSSLCYAREWRSGLGFGKLTQDIAEVTSVKSFLSSQTPF